MGPWYKKAWKLISHPYAFLEEAVDRGNPVPATAVFVTALIVKYLGWSLTVLGQKTISGFQVLISLLLPLVSYPVAVLAIFLICRLQVRENRPRAFFTVWGFSYLPTLFIFLVYLLAHFALKFPLMVKLLGQPLLILVLWALVFLMFLWKLLFLTITLRLAGNLNLRQIILSLIVLGVVTGFYWWAASIMGWMRIPFI